MNLLKTYQASLIISCLLFVSFWFAPWLYGYLDAESQQILSYGGIKASIYLPDWFFNIYLILTIISYIGMYLFRKAFRLLFVLILAVSIPLETLFGMVVMTGIEATMLDISNILSGIVIALAYFTELKSKFY